MGGTSDEARAAKPKPAAASRPTKAAAAVVASQPSKDQPDEAMPDFDKEEPAGGGEKSTTTATSTVTTTTAIKGVAAASASASADPPPLPGHRAARLQALFDSSLTHTLARISWDNFAACYPTAAARAPTALRTVHSAMVARLRELCTAEFALVMRNRDVVRKLNELEALMDDGRRRRQQQEQQQQQQQQNENQNEGRQPQTAKAPVAPHTLPPSVVMAAHLHQQRRDQMALLADRLQAVQAANSARFARLAAQQAEADQLVSALERALADANAAAALLDQDNLAADLALETRTAEVDMSEV